MSALTRLTFEVNLRILNIWITGEALTKHQPSDPDSADGEILMSIRKQRLLPLSRQEY